MRFVPPLLAGLALATAITTVAGTARADDVPLDPSTRGLFAVGVGFGGESDLEVDGASGGSLSGSAALEATPTFTLRGEVPVFSYFMVGGQVVFARWGVEDADDRNSWLDLGATLTGAVDIDLGEVALEPRLTVPLGLSLNIFHENAADGLDLFGIGRTNAGLHIGVLPGLGVYFSKGFGLLVEAGYLHRRAFAKDDADNRWQLRQGQGLVQLGFVFAL